MYNNIIFIQYKVNNNISILINNDKEIMLYINLI